MRLGNAGASVSPPAFMQELAIERVKVSSSSNMNLRSIFGTPSYCELEMPAAADEELADWLCQVLLSDLWRGSFTSTSTVHDKHDSEQEQHEDGHGGLHLPGMFASGWDVLGADFHQGEVNEACQQGSGDGCDVERGP